MVEIMQSVSGEEISDEDVRFFLKMCPSLITTIGITNGNDVTIGSSRTFHVKWLYNPNVDMHSDMHDVNFNGDSDNMSLQEWYDYWRAANSGRTCQLFIPIAILQCQQTKIPIMVYWGSRESVRYLVPVGVSNSTLLLVFYSSMPDLHSLREKYHTDDLCNAIRFAGYYGMSNTRYNDIFVYCSLPSRAYTSILEEIAAEMKEIEEE